MRKHLLLTVFLMGVSVVMYCQSLKSPTEYLGYELGSKFTLHYNIAGYFQQAAAAMPQSMRLTKYGETNEARPLLIAVVSSPENITRLEDIRLNNLRLTGMLNDKSGNINEPAIVWLSYNVHGNEPSSSEAAMKQLYALLNPSVPQVTQWLKNTVVIIDPCLNPDGRDRYVNFITQVTGNKPNANGDAREHKDPWPQGRTNHYYFDLNRDWAWQSQIESQQRIKIYNEWMPHIHCDYHEQHYNDNYYFAPAAEPMHEVITPWQREFQTTIGKNHASYFDKNNWLYFTREIFDLFYPSYGDTYPTYNGAIGMTYEQAGIGAGLAVQKNDGDTLTLKDRIEAHFTTGMSTIETTSKNAARVVKEFNIFFQERKPAKYKAYVIKADGSKNLSAVKKLLDVNKINYSSVETTANGMNYATGKDENFSITKNDILINAHQPKAILLQVLFEPATSLPDSVTYDITAWSIPYAYGLNAYAVKTIAASSGVKVAAVVQKSEQKLPVNSGFAYLIPVNGFNGSKILAALINSGLNVRFSEREFQVQGEKFDRGTLIITRSGNAKLATTLDDLVQKACSDNCTQPTIISSGFIEKGFDLGSSRMHLIKKPHVLLVTGDGIAAEPVGEVWNLFDNELKYPITLVNASDINGALLKRADVLIVADEVNNLSDKIFLNALKEWVKQGGRLIAISGAAAQLTQADWGIKLKKTDDDSVIKSDYDDVKAFQSKDNASISNNIAGAIYKVELDNSHPLAFGYPNHYFTLKLNTNVFEFLKEGWNVGVLKKKEKVAGFVGNSVKNKIKDGTVIAVQQMEDGTVVYFTDDPIFRDFWENGKQLLANAVFLLGQ